MRSSYSFSSLSATNIIAALCVFGMQVILHAEENAASAKIPAEVKEQSVQDAVPAQNDSQAEQPKQLEQPDKPEDKSQSANQPLPTLPDSVKQADNEKKDSADSKTPKPSGNQPLPEVPEKKDAQKDSTAAADKTENQEKEPPLAKPEETHSKILSESDTAGRSVRITFFDKNNNPTDHGQLTSSLETKTLGATGFASVKFDYAGDGKNEKPILWEFFDTEGKPTLTSQGYSKIAFEFNKEGREVKRSYLDENNALVNNGHGFAALKRSFDGTKRLIKEAYYDKDGRLSLNTKKGYAVMNVAYVNNDKEEYELKTFQDAQTNPVKIDGAYKHSRGLSKSEPPLTILQSYNGLDDKLMKGPDGYALHISRPVDNPQNPKEAYLDENSQLVDGPEGFAQQVLSKDDRTKMYKLQFLDAMNTPVNNTSLGWSYKLFRMGKEGEQNGSEFYDKDGKRVYINEAFK